MKLKLLSILILIAISNTLIAQKYPILFYSARNTNHEVYIKYPADTEPINLSNNPNNDNCPAISPDGKTIVFLSDRSGTYEIYTMKIDGTEVKQLTFSEETKEHPRYSPDGQKIIFIKDYKTKTEVWIMNSDGTEQEQITSNDTRDERPNISPDGSKILFMSNRTGNYDIFTMNIDGTEQTNITNSIEHEIFPIWSPSGEKIAYSINNLREQKAKIHILNLKTSADTVLTLATDRNENPEWSQCGQHIVFQSERDGNFEVYTMNTDGTEPNRISFHPEWDGWACFVPIEE